MPYTVEFRQLTADLLDLPEVQSMGQWEHHGRVTTLDHSLNVAYWSYRIARKLGLDVAAAARGGLLHDLYLYDKNNRTAHPGLQCFDHPRIAADNALKLAALSPKEENIIRSHMWPIGGALPRSAEAWLVDLVDTGCAALELARVYHPQHLRRRLVPACQKRHCLF